MAKRTAKKAGKKAAKKAGARRGARAGWLNLDLLTRLCETPGVPGREERVRALIESEIEGLFDTVETDPMGSLICTRKARGRGQNPTKVMLLCHMDEIGFYVSYVDDKGFIWIDTAGGFDPRNLFSRRVLVCTKGRDYHGVMNPCGRPVHISSPEERTKVPQLKEFFVDIGLPAEQVKSRVKIGDYIVMDEPAREMGDKFTSKALDNRVACWLGIESIRELVRLGGNNACEIVVAFTTQEEVGLRGARTAAYSVKPCIGLGIDVTLACDTPGVPDNEAVTFHGKGFGLHVKDSSFIADHELVDTMEAIATKHNIPYQRSILRAGGQDGAAAQQSAAGARAVGITVGTRYIHTVTEMIDKGDLAAARDVLARYLAETK
jgi:endoglucanase